MPTDDLLALGSDTEGVLAHYGQTDAGGEMARTALFIVRYPSAARAEQGRKHFTSGYLSGADAGISRKEHGWAGIKASDDMVVGVLDAGSAEQVGELFTAVDRTRDGAK